jgi:hypothetical protein
MMANGRMSDLGENKKKKTRRRSRSDRRESIYLNDVIAELQRVHELHERRILRPFFLRQYEPFLALRGQPVWQIRVQCAQASR